jgi:hypothetical protein
MRQGFVSICRRGAAPPKALRFAVTALRSAGMTSKDVGA